MQFKKRNSLFEYCKQLFSDCSHLFFPHCCEGCGTDVLSTDAYLCARCLFEMPKSGMIERPSNILELRLRGRFAFHAAAAGYYYRKEGLIQHLIYQLKYGGKREIGVFLGQLLGYELLKSNRFATVDALIPIPLNEKKFRKRGYNQAEAICEGIAHIWQKPVVTNLVGRALNTTTQTKQTQMGRWSNVQKAFALSDKIGAEYSHLLLVDDVITTGSTIESCANELLQIPNITISILGVAFTGAH